MTTMNANRNSLLWKLILPVPIMLLVGLVTAWFLIPQTILGNARQSATHAGAQTAAQFKTIRGYYTKNVIKKVVQNGSMKPSFNHASEPDSIPLPATFIHDLSALLAEENTSINLYSDYPFPLRDARQLDTFQQQAWAFLQQNPDDVFVRQENREGREIIRVATADRMVAEGCVNCHNSHPESPKTDWQLGDVRGILEVNTDITEQLAAGTALSRSIVIALLACGLILTLVTCYFAQNATRPLKRIAAVMRRLADDDKSVEVTDLGRRDEVGEMAEAVQVFKDNALRMEQLQRENAAKDEAAEAQHKQALRSLADGFKSTIMGIVDTVASAATEMRSTASSMTETAKTTNDMAATVSRSADDVAAHMQSVSGTSEELASSIREISGQVANSTQVTKAAKAEAEITNEKVAGLVASADLIGDVVKMISDIAEQTNLLALNATIEAARAGEAGKGFAVVAGEVKSLAAQTAKATGEISDQIARIQGSTGEAAQAIEAINTTINEINEITAAVSAAVEEQGAATQEIARTVKDASSGSQEVMTNAGRVSQSSQETGNAAEQVLAAAADLSQQSETLRREIDAFLERVVAA